MKDETFAGEILGKGMAVIPSEGKVYAPFDGTVETIFPTGHAVALKSAQGVEALIHVGMDTVKLNGKYYTAKVQDGASVKKGDLLVEFDLDGIRGEGYDVTTPVVITNTDEYAQVKAVKTGKNDGRRSGDRDYPVKNGGGKNTDAGLPGNECGPAI